MSSLLSALKSSTLPALLLSPGGAALDVEPVRGADRLALVSALGSLVGGCCAPLLAGEPPDEVGADTLTLLGRAATLLGGVLGSSPPPAPLAASLGTAASTLSAACIPLSEASGAPARAALAAILRLCEAYFVARAQKYKRSAAGVVEDPAYFACCREALKLHDTPEAAWYRL